MYFFRINFWTLCYQEQSQSSSGGYPGGFPGGFPGCFPGAGGGGFPGEYWEQVQEILKKKHFYLIDVSQVLVIFPQFSGQNVNKNKTILYEIMRSSSVAS